MRESRRGGKGMERESGLRRRGDKFKLRIGNPKKLFCDSIGKQNPSFLYSKPEKSLTMGLLSYFRKYIEGFATVANTLTSLLLQRPEWEWGEKQEKAVQILKNKLLAPPILVPFDPQKVIAIHADGSGKRVGSYLGHEVDWRLSVFSDETI